MADIATCATCGEVTELCQSVRIDGIQQPRFCKDCLLLYVEKGDMKVNDLYWIVQMGELGDEESINALAKQAKSE